MIEAEIVNYFSPDIDDVWEWSPIEGCSIYYILELEVAKKGEEYGDEFQVEIMNNKAYQEFLAKGRKFKGVKFLLVEDYSWENTLKALTQFVDSCKAETWEQVVQALQKKFQWEYEGYDNESRSSNFH